MYINIFNRNNPIKNLNLFLNKIMKLKNDKILFERLFVHAISLKNKWVATPLSHR